MAAQALPPSIRRRERTVHQIHLGPPQQGGLGEAEPHQPGAGIGEAAGRIERFAGGAGAHQQAAAAPVAPPAPHGEGFQAQQQPLGFRHAAIADPVAGQQAAGGGQGHHPLPALQGLPVGCHAGGAPHGGVHGRRHQHRRLAGQQHRGHQGVAQPVHPAAQGGGTEGRQQHQLGPFGQLHMEGPGGSGAPGVVVAVAGVAAEAGQGHWAHQPRSGGGDGTAHQGAALHQGAHQLRQLHCRDAAADQHQHPAAGQGIGGAAGFSRGCKGISQWGQGDQSSSKGS